MKLKNIVLVVSDIRKAKDFYKEIFGLEVVADFGENIIMTEGLVLQEKCVWEESIGRNVVIGGNIGELYFEDIDLDKFIEKLDNSQWEIEYINKNIENAGGFRAIRIYDLDKHIIEIGEKKRSIEKRSI